MAINGDAGRAIAIMWALTAATLVFVILRLHVRQTLKITGVDDYVYCLLFLLCYTVFTTISAAYGFGQKTADIIDPQDIVDAKLFGVIGQIFAIVGMAVAKCSLGLFFLRIVQLRWHKALIWLVMGFLMATSISDCFVFLLHCTPPGYLWDDRIKGGYCHIDHMPTSLLVCSMLSGSLKATENSKGLHFQSSLRHC
ncbi:hypothetical protein VFPPC_03811 [Pochonia chlamydosporia 170]|uniref:Rhodopsin domain-containing protein n=1 Tax=Pochonia chlamydosporia 170 TaxID=1380566 RepID=A0A179F338_METCM|nr:hypothetical protein VFPPC_03811 [Pochonia chlamydosporia 170]OAQ59583.2 hypothetical protein VFPPC_03811 [Pochonia chlamydosporia 170]